MNKKKDLISIVMPVYNAAEFLPDCLDSILSQTHKNWELVAVDDHSPDNSLKILRTYAKRDKRIRVYANPRNLGVSATANRAVKLAKSSWIARMDADDIMVSNRLSIQLKTLKEHPSVVVIGSQCNLINSNNKKIGKKLFPTCPKEIFNMLFWACPVQQPSIMVNAAKLPDTFRWYTDGAKTGEEINFLIRISKYGNIVNSKKTLLLYRLHDDNLSYNQDQKNVFFKLFRTRIKAVLSGHYRPSFGSFLIGLAELVVISLLPKESIMPVFQFVRGMKALKLRLKLPTVFPQARALHLSA